MERLVTLYCCRVGPPDKLSHLDLTLVIYLHLEVLRFGTTHFIHNVQSLVRATDAHTKRLSVNKEVKG